MTSRLRNTINSYDRRAYPAARCDGHFRVAKLHNTRVAKDNGWVLGDFYRTASVYVKSIAAG